ncbi:zinc-binding alcohol dehydrogenase family protein [Actinoplanes sp. TBRC 11911]|uniref:zinc-binding alcohol dehydrogenase family protein n=1 Tax=Actinoplanes sp. TBRC 11911 TaxID=2729386 RepID=UPI00145CFF07|nr:zinc-binding alcohol dehydrogenase family protein [Actinoplanes sp. TBRC 11911]NMO57257.1 zinc-binding alcohol dehydrogenase family protein [Actinoplanes sp. TBRC 11911]
MYGWQVEAPGPDIHRAMTRVAMTAPRPAPGELLVAVDACGVCRTDLHVVSGDLPVHRRGVVPGHEIVGHVVELGAGVTTFKPGDRVGVAWLRETDATCRYCVRGAENLCPASRYTGWDVDGGYADYTTVRADFAYTLPDGYSDVELAPLLCAGIIGYRALHRADLPEHGVLGIYGFGASAHLTAQVALARGARVHVLTRSLQAQKLALKLGATSTAGAYDAAPEPLDAAVLFAPVGDLVPVALQALDRGGTLAIAGIHLSDIPALNYDRDLFQERTVRSVTANTREDGRDLLAFAAEHHLHVAATPYPMERAAEALVDLAADRVNGAAVLVP